MKKRARTIPSRETLYYAALVAFVFGAALVKQMNLLVILGGMLLGPLLINWRAGLAALRRLEVRRRLPQGITAGEVLSLRFELTSHRRWSGTWAISVEDTVHPLGRPEELPLRPEVWFPYVGPRQSATLLARARVPRRGRYRFGPLTLSTRFPFGLLLASRTVLAEETLLVYPRLGRLTRAWRTWRQEMVEGARQRQQQGRASGEFFGVREWHQGDHPRWIHWRSSAKHGTLVVRQFEQPRSHAFAILLDLWQPETPTPEALENVELAVSLAATLITTFCRQETNHLFLGIAGVEPTQLQGPVSAALREEAIEQLALAEATSQERLSALLFPALDRIEAASQIVLISTREPPLDAGLGRDPHRRLLLRQIRKINTASPRLAEYFSVD